MKPTTNLRFVERLVPAVVHGEPVLKAVRTLQQWWAHDPDCYEDFVLKANGEWRDVPLENEA